MNLATEMSQSSGPSTALLSWEEQTTKSRRKQSTEWKNDDVETDKTIYVEEEKRDISERSTLIVPDVPPTTPEIDQAPAEPFVPVLREELDGFVERVVADRAYVVFETAGGQIRRTIRLSRLAAVNADQQGALIRLVVEEDAASTKLKLENLADKGIATWRDKIEDKDFEKYNLLRQSRSEG